MAQARAAAAQGTAIAGSDEALDSTAAGRLLRCLDTATALRRQDYFGLAGALLVLLIVSFAMLRIGDYVNASGMAVTRFMARGQAPLIGQLYPTAARDRITVLMYDQAFLRDSGSAWPISYEQHADWLLRLASDPQTRPRAVMIDIIFAQARQDATVGQLHDALCTLQNEYGVAVFLAALPSPSEGRLRVRKELEAKDREGRDCFTPVGVRQTPDPLDGLAWTYPVTTHLDGTVWQDGPLDATTLTNPQPAAAPMAFRSAAVMLAEQVEGVRLGTEVAPMSLVWGTRTALSDDRPTFLQHCDPQASGWSRLVPGPLRTVLMPQSQRPFCPFHTTLTMGQLDGMDTQALAPLLKDRYVFVGAVVDGYNDFVNSPVHGHIPGIYLHAMALDNLLNYAGDYKHATEWEKDFTADMFFACFVAVLAVFFAHLAWLKFANRLEPVLRVLNKPSAAFGPSAPPAAQDAGRWRLRACKAGRTAGSVLLGVLAWLLKLWLQVTAAMLLIALLQTVLRIGMLPVTELVGMTLLAEGLGLVRKLRDFLADHLGTEAQQGQTGSVSQSTSH